MQLDKTNIAVRERGQFEILDLALQVIRRNGGKILLAMLPGVVVFGVINHLLIGWMASPDYYPYEDGFLPIRYVWNMSWLVFLETPLASVLATLYLGQVVFHDRPSLRKTYREARSCWKPLLVYQGIIRGPIFAYLLLWWAEDFEWYSPYEFFVVVLCFVVGLIRSLRPFLNEVILLERNPWRSKDKNAATVSRRNALIHTTYNNTSLFGRWLVTSFVVVLMAGALAHGELFCWGVFGNSWRWTPWLVNLGIPAAFWLTATFSVVVRFLSYLDLRIRNEGWEVDLRLRAEASRQLHRMA